MPKRSNRPDKSVYIPNLQGKALLMETYLEIFRCYREYFGNSNAAGIMLVIHVDLDRRKHKMGGTPHAAGMSLRFISALTGIPKSTVKDVLDKMLETDIFAGDATNFAFALDVSGIPILQTEIPEVKELLAKFFNSVKDLDIERVDITSLAED